MESRDFLEGAEARAVNKKIKWAGAVKPIERDLEPEPVEEIYKNGSQEPEARTFLEGAGAESQWKKVQAPKHWYLVKHLFKEMYVTPYLDFKLKLLCHIN